MLENLRHLVFLMYLCLFDLINQTYFCQYDLLPNWLHDITSICEQDKQLLGLEVTNIFIPVMFMLKALRWFPHFVPWLTPLRRRKVSNASSKSQFSPPKSHNALFLLIKSWKSFIASISSSLRRNSDTRASPFSENKQW